VGMRPPFRIPIVLSSRSLLETTRGLEEWGTGIQLRTRVKIRGARKTRGRSDDMSVYTRIFMGASWGTRVVSSQADLCLTIMSGHTVWGRGDSDADSQKHVSDLTWLQLADRKRSHR